MTMNITVNIHEAKTHLSCLVEQAAKGQEFVIARASKPMVWAVPVDVLPTTRTLGFLAGRGTIKADLKSAFAQDIDAMFKSAK